MGTKIKICGLRRPEDITYVNEACPDFAGFIVNVPKSKRNIDAGTLKVLCGLLREEIIPVGVFVNEDPACVADLLNQQVIQIAQLHGTEDEAYIKELRSRINRGDKVQIIKAFKVRSASEVAFANASSADLVLLDGGAGDGKVFDWTVLSDVSRPFLLAGGLDEGNILDAIAKVHPFGVDLSSGAETNGVKDKGKICRLVQMVRQAG